MHSVEGLCRGSSGGQQTFFNNGDIKCAYNTLVRHDQPFVLTLVVKPAKKILDDIDPRQLLVIGMYDCPWCCGIMGVCEHLVARQAVFFPFLERKLVESAYFPLRKRVFFAIVHPLRLL